MMLRGNNGWRFGLSEIDGYNAHIWMTLTPHSGLVRHLHQDNIPYAESVASQLTLRGFVSAYFGLGISSNAPNSRTMAQNSILKF